MIMIFTNKAKLTVQKLQGIKTQGTTVSIYVHGNLYSNTYYIINLVGG